jgi:S-adenosylmethionine/arginine decarboxylase-like enzyme
MKDLAPSILRQRLVIEGKCDKIISEEEIKKYLGELSEKLQMVALIEPVTHKSTKFGWAGWIHWETSGAHFYAWDEPFYFFSVDIYTCKAFDAKVAVDFTADFFKALEVVFKSI